MKRCSEPSACFICCWMCGDGPGRIHLVESGGCEEPSKDKGRTEIKLLYLLLVTPRSSSSSSGVTGESAVVMWSLRSCRSSRLQLKDYLFHSQAEESAPPHQFTACRYHLIVAQWRRDSKTSRSMFCLFAQ